MFRFTIRDVLWLTALVAMGAAWLIDHAQLAGPAGEARLWKDRHDHVVNEMQERGWNVEWAKFHNVADVLIVKPETPPASPTANAATANSLGERKKGSLPASHLKSNP